MEAARSLEPETFETQGQSWQPGILERQLGLAYTLLAQPAPAQAAFIAARALIEAPPGAATLRAQAEAAYRQGQWHPAMLALAEAIAIDQPRPGEWAQLAMMGILRSGHSDSARRLSRYALSINPTDAAAADLTAIMDYAQGNFWGPLQELIGQILTRDPGQQSRQLLTDIAGLFRLSPIELVRQHGLRLIISHAYEPASEAFALLVQDAPADIAGYKSLAVALDALGRADDAAMVWQVARNLAEKNES